MIELVQVVAMGGLVLIPVIDWLANRLRAEGREAEARRIIRHRQRHRDDWSG